MTARVGDEITVTPQEPTEPVREGQIRGVRHDPGGVIYVVQWCDTGYESLLPHGPGVVIKRGHTRGNETLSRRKSWWPSRLRRRLARGHRDLERWQEVGYERLACRVEEIIAGLGLTQSDFSVAAGHLFHMPQVVSVGPGPPVRLDIRILPGQSPHDYSAHAAAIAYDLGMAKVRVIPLGPSAVRLELLPHDRISGPLSW